MSRQAVISPKKYSIMKVKGIKNNPQAYRKVRNILKRKKRLSAGIFGFIGLAVSVMLFFAVFNYGRYLYNSGQTQLLVPVLKDLSALDFSFVNNYARGQMAELDEVKIDIKFRHLLRIEYLRKQAMKEKYINPAFKEEEFPAKLTYKGKTYNVKIALTGMVSRTHVGNPNKWSFEVKVKGDDTIAGMKRLALLVPTARGYLTDWLSFELLQARGLIGTRVDFVDVSINGKSSGVFYMEERFDKYMIENNALREGIIFKLEKEVGPYRESKLMEEPGPRAQLLLLRRMWQDVMAGDLPSDKFFDMEKMAKLFIVSDLMNNQHPLSKANLRFYFNPVTGLAEPIAREFEDLSKSDPSAMKMFLEKPDLYSRHFWLESESIIGLIYDNPEFKRHYIREAELVCQQKYLDDFFAERSGKLEAILGKVYRTLPFYKFPREQLYANQHHMRSVIFSEQPELLAWLEQKEEGALGIRLENQQSLPLEITHLSWQGAAFLPDHPVLVDSRAREGNHTLRIHQFRIPEGVALPDGPLSGLKVHYNLLGLERGKKELPVAIPSGEKAASLPAALADQPGNYAAFPFIREKTGENILLIPAGEWTLGSSLAIPRGKRLHIEAGARINLVNNARIISYAPVFCMGKEGRPVLIHSADSTGGGLAVIGAEGRSVITHTHFEGLSGIEENGQRWGGAVTFYESPVTFSGCSFSGRQGGGDLLNIVRADFTVNRAKFTDAPADAFDCGHCSGEISYSSFVKSGNNAISLTGAEVKLSNIFISQVGEKGLSAGQNSEVTARWMDIRRAGAAITSESRSKVMASDVQLLNNRIGISLSREHAAYGPAYASVERIDIQQSETPYQVAANAELIVDGRPYSQKTEGSKRNN